MQRLRDYLLDDAPILASMTVSFAEDSAGRVLLAGEVDAQVTMTCQRCTEAVTLDVHGEFSLGVIRSPEEEAGLPEDVDALLLDRGPELNLAELAEDEIIIGLPVIPRHADINECGDRATLLQEEFSAAESDGGAQEDDAAGEGEKENPFALLQKLKDGKSED